jgi:hypothetical protein
MIVIISMDKLAVLCFPTTSLSFFLSTLGWHVALLHIPKTSCYTFTTFSQNQAFWEYHESGWNSERLMCGNDIMWWYNVYMGDFLGLKEMNNSLGKCSHTGPMGRGFTVFSITRHKHENTTLCRLFILVV